MGAGFSIKLPENPAVDHAFASTYNLEIHGWIVLLDGVYELTRGFWRAVWWQKQVLSDWNL